MSTNSLTDAGVSLVALPHHYEDNGDLVVIEALTHVPFRIARVFVVRAPPGAIRGQHAHKMCAQFLTCPTGRVEVVCDDGLNEATYVLDQPDVGLLVPAGIWSQQTYQAESSVLTVLCDRPYEAHDYIRDYEEFRAYRRSQRLVNRERA
jgi:dTDP-4-dehydrorhamnose 3,5-epimerase-like enzyme